jgi:hypothetical protein
MYYHTHQLSHITLSGQKWSPLKRKNAAPTLSDRAAMAAEIVRGVQKF